MQNDLDYFKVPTSGLRFSSVFQKYMIDNGTLNYSSFVKWLNDNNCKLKQVSQTMWPFNAEKDFASSCDAL